MNWKPTNSTLANSDDPNKMAHTTALHQGMHCLLRQNCSLEKEIQFYLGFIACDPYIYTMDLPKFIVSNQKEEYRAVTHILGKQTS